MMSVKKKARELGVDCGKMKKDELIRTIQRTEGNSVCFGSSGGNCEQEQCCFMSDCVKVK